MKSRRPEIFVSATSADLKSCRKAVKEALLTLGCVPVEQSNFPPDHRTVADMLRKKIGECDAVIHIAGECSGHEPKERNPSQPRCSYTQLEYRIARELDKSVFVFVCGRGFPYDAHEAEPDDKRELQEAHRRRLLADPHLHTSVHSVEDLSMRVHALQTRVEQLGLQLRESHSRLGRTISISIVALVALAAAIALLTRRANVAEKELMATNAIVAGQKETLAALQTKLQEVARNTDIVAARLMRADAPIKDDDARDRVRIAQSAAALEIGIPVSELRQRLAAEGTDLKRMLADLSAMRDTSAAVLKDLTDLRRETLTKLGDNEFAAGRPDSAQAIFSEVLREAVAAKDDAARARLQLKIGNANVAGAKSAMGTDAKQRLERASVAFEDALEILEKLGPRTEWAEAKRGMGIVLYLRATENLGKERDRLVAESVASYREALSATDRGENLEQWADIRLEFMAAVGEKIKARPPGLRADAEVEEALSLLREGLAAYRKDAHPSKWAVAHALLASMRIMDGSYRTYAEYQREYERTVADYRESLAICTPKADFENWAQLMYSLGGEIRNHAYRYDVPTEKRLPLIDEALAHNETVLAALDRATQSRLWHVMKFQVARLQVEKAQLLPRFDPVRTNLIVQASASFEDYAKEFAQREPHLRLGAQLMLAGLYEARAEVSRESQKPELLKKSLSQLRLALKTGLDHGADEKVRQIRGLLARQLRAIAEKSPQTERAPYYREAIDELRAFVEASIRGQTGDTVSFEIGERQREFGRLLRLRDAASSPEERIRLLTEAAEFYRATILFNGVDSQWVTPEYHKELGDTLRELASQPGVAEREALLIEAASAYRKALVWKTREKHRFEWRLLNESIGDALLERKNAAEMSAAVGLIRQAIDAFDLVLSSGLVDANGNDWRRLFGKKAEASYALAQCLPKEEKSAAFGRAADAFGTFISGLSFDSHPEQWLSAQLKLAESYYGQGANADAPQAEHFDRSVAAYRAVLGGISRTDRPEAWGGLHEKIGLTLESKSFTVPAGAKAAVLVEAIQAYRQSLEIKTRTEHPKDWGELQRRIGECFKEVGEAATKEKRAAFYAEALQALNAAYEVDPPDTPAVKRAEQKFMIGFVRFHLAEESPGDAGIALLRLAVGELREAASVLDAENSHAYWVGTQETLATSLFRLARAGNPADRERQLTEAERHARTAWTGTSRERFQFGWARSGNVLCAILRELAIEAGHANKLRLLNEAVSVGKRCLEVDLREAYPELWAERHYNYAAALGALIAAIGNGRTAPDVSEAIRALERAAEVFTPDAFPEWSRRTSTLRSSLQDLAKGSAGSSPK
jgi:tetratricopeptide (TPR) repeat protein